MPPKKAKKKAQAPAKKTPPPAPPTKPTSPQSRETEEYKDFDMDTASEYNSSECEVERPAVDQRNIERLAELIAKERRIMELERQLEKKNQRIEELERENKEILCELSMLKISSHWKKPTMDVATNTEEQQKINPPPPPPAPPVPKRSYAEAACQTTSAPPPPPSPPPPPPPPTSANTPLPPRPRKSAPPPPTTPAVRALVMHAAPTKYKPGEMWNWIQDDNKVQILGVRWLLKQDRRGKDASSLVIYLRTPMPAGHLRMGRNRFRTTEYEWDRPGAANKGKYPRRMSL